MAWATGVMHPPRPRLLPPGIFTESALQAPVAALPTWDWKFVLGRLSLNESGSEL